MLFSLSPPVWLEAVSWVSLICDEKTLCCINRLCWGRLRMYTTPYRQLAPNNSLTVHRAMSLQDPVVPGWSRMKHRSTTTQLWVATRWPWGPRERWLYTATWQCTRVQWLCDKLPNFKVGNMKLLYYYELQAGQPGKLGKMFEKWTRSF